VTANDVALAARVVVALILVASGVGKLLAASRSFSEYREQFGDDTRVATLVGVALPVYEVMLAVLLLVVDAAWPSWLALATFAVFTLVLARRIVRGDSRPCNCFGAASTRELSVGSMVRNTWFVALALIATGTNTLAEPSAVLGTVLVGCALLGVSAVLVVRT
jgi:hypothetical protein